jgi:hypothetical protein
MMYDLNHDNLLDVMLLRYMEYVMNDKGLEPNVKWVRVCDVMQHLSQQGIAEFLMTHATGSSNYNPVWELREQLWVEKLEENWEKMLPPQESEE